MTPIHWISFILCVGCLFWEIQSSLNATDSTSTVHTPPKPRSKTLYHVLESDRPHLLTYGGLSSSKNDESQSTSILVQSIPIRPNPSSHGKMEERRFIAFDFDPIFPTYNSFVFDERASGGGGRRISSEEQMERDAAFLEETFFIKIHDITSLVNDVGVTTTDGDPEKSDPGPLVELSIPNIISIEEPSYISSEPTNSNIIAEDIQNIKILPEIHARNPEILDIDNHIDELDTSALSLSQPMENNHSTALSDEDLAKAKGETLPIDSSQTILNDTGHLLAQHVEQIDLISLDDPRTKVYHKSSHEEMIQVKDDPLTPDTETRNTFQGIDGESESSIYPLEEHEFTTNEPIRSSESDDESPSHVQSVLLDPEDQIVEVNTAVSTTSTLNEHGEKPDVIKLGIQLEGGEDPLIVNHEVSLNKDDPAHPLTLEDVSSIMAETVNKTDVTSLSSTDDDTFQGLNDLEVLSLKEEPSTETTPPIPRSDNELFSSANHDFVHGLDDFHKFLEEVDPPDELDVGASGLSIQEILMGQGTKILKTKIREGIQQLKEFRNKVINGLTGNKEGDDVFVEFDVDQESAVSKTYENGKNALISVIREPKEQIAHVTSALKSAMSHTERFFKELLSLWGKFRSREEVFDNDDDESSFDHDIAELKRKLDENRMIQRRSVSQSKKSDNSFEDSQTVG